MAEEDKKQQIDKKLSEINGLIDPYKLAYVSPEKNCKLLDRNSHYMDKDIFEKLVNNVAKDGFLSQLPFGMYQESTGKYLILSGNQRVKSAIKANLEYILILYMDELPEDKQIAYQLSHNAIIGKDDTYMVKELFEKLNTIDAKEFSGFNDFDFPDFKAENLPTINEKDIELHEIRFYFTEIRAVQMDKLFAKLENKDIKYEESRFINMPYKEFIKVLTEFKKHKKIKSNTVAFIKMVKMIEEIIEKENNEG